MCVGLPHMISDCLHCISKLMYCISGRHIEDFSAYVRVPRNKFLPLVLFCSVGFSISILLSGCCYTNLWYSAVIIQPFSSLLIFLGATLLLSQGLLSAQPSYSG
jgi:hypothetical protein